MPQSFERLHMRRDRCPTRLWAHAVVRTHDSSAIVADILVYDEDGSRVADILGFRMEAVDEKQQSDGLDECYYRFEWQPRRLRGSGPRGPCAYPTTAEIKTSVAAAFSDVQQRHALDEYRDRFVPEAEAVALLLEQRALADLGWRPRVGDGVELGSFVDALGIVDDYRRVTRRLLRHFERTGLLRATGEDAWVVLDLPTGSGSEAALDRLDVTFPAYRAEIDLFKRTGVKLASILAGESDALELLFPGGSHDPMERYYTEALGFPAHLELTRIAVERAIASLPDRRALRVLEVGGGTGVLTKTVLPVLPDTGRNTCLRMSAQHSLPRRANDLPMFRSLITRSSTWKRIRRPKAFTPDSST